MKKKLLRNFGYDTFELILPHVCLDTLPMCVVCSANKPDGTFLVHAVFYEICIYKMCFFGQNLVSAVVILVECPYPVFQMFSYLLLNLKVSTCVLMVALNT